MIHIVLVFIKWVFILTITVPVMFLFSVKVFDQWVAGEFQAESDWFKKFKR